MGICPGQAPMTMSPFYLLRVTSVPSEEDSASCEVLAFNPLKIQTLISVCSANYAFFLETIAQTALPLKNRSGGKG